MKQRVCFSFHLGRLSLPRTSDIARSAGCEFGVEKHEDSFLAGAFEATFDADDPRLMALRTRLEREQIDWLERVDQICTVAELLRAPLLELGVDLPPRDVEKPVREQCDLSTGCPRCGTGASGCARAVARLGHTCEGPVIPVHA